MYERDLLGYGGKPPDANWPNGARVAVSVVVNVEEGAEMAVSRGDARNEPVYDMIAAIEAQEEPSNARTGAHIAGRTAASCSGACDRI